MSTIQRSISPYAWWYVATALLAGALLALTITVLQAGDAAALNPPPAVGLPARHYDLPSHVCFAMPHYPTIELARSGCYQ